jgi:hypothetical protein
MNDGSGVASTQTQLHRSSQAGATRLFFMGAQPPRLWFGAPRAEPFAEGWTERWVNPEAKTDGEGVVGCARGGRAPFSNCLVPVKGPPVCFPAP